MATKKETGNAPAPEPEPKKPVKEPGSVPDPTPEPTPEPSDIPERFQGKNLGQVIEMYEKAEKDRDRSGTEVGNLRKDIDDIKNTASYYQNMAQDLQRKSEQGGKPEGNDIQFNYDNPLPSIEQVVERVLKKDRETRGKADKEQEYKRASMNFATGRGKAMKDNPDLFSGIENQLEKGMWQYYQNGNVTVDELRDSKTWENGARMIHMANENWERIVPPKVEPVSPTPTEKPGAAKTPSEEEAPKMELDDFGTEMKDHAIKGGMEEKDFNKLVQETKKREGR
jgi:hypothetical protein